MKEKYKKKVHRSQKTRQFQTSQSRKVLRVIDRKERRKMHKIERRIQPLLCKANGKKGGNSEERTHLLNFNEQRILSTGKINRNLKLTTGTIRKLLDYGKHEFNFPKLTYWKNKSK